MQYNGIKAKSFKMQDGGTLVELRYDATNNKINGVYISKDNGTTFKKLLDEDEVSTRINNFIATIQSGLSTPISINLESALPNISNAVAWSSVSDVSTSTTYSAGDKLAKDGVMYEVINTVSIKDDGSDDPQTFLNSGDMKVFVKDGTYYSIQNMDITKPGHTGRAWYNSNASINTWQTSYDDTGRPIMEYDDITVGEQIAEDSTITKDKVFYRALTDVTCSGNWVTDKSNFEELKTSGAILNHFEANRYYSENEMIIEDNVIYTRKTAGTSSATLGADISNWEPQTRLHTSGSRHVEFKISTATYPSAGIWTTQNLVYVDGDQSMIGTNTLIVPVDGLYYAHIFPFTVLPTAGSSIIRITNPATSAVLSVNISGALGASNFSSQSGLDAILHLSKGDMLRVEMYSTVKPTSSNPSPCEFGLIAEDQSDNVVAEADYEAFTSTTNSITPIALKNITNPSVISSSGIITLPEDGTYVLSIDSLNSVSGASQGTYSTYVFRGSETTAIAYATGTGTSGQMYPLTTIIGGYKGDTYSIKRVKNVAQPNLVIQSDKRGIKLLKLKSVTQSLNSQDLYNEYLQRLPSGVTPNSYEGWLKGLVSRNQLRVKVKVVNQTRATTGLIQHKFTYIEGEQSMLNNNCFVAPVAGLYSIYIPSFATNGSHTANSVGWTTVMRGVTNVDDAYIGFAYTNNTITIPNCEVVVWLDKDEVVSAWWGENQTNSISLLRNNYDSYAEFTLIQGGHPQIEYPNTWTPGVEYDFGNGLYGQRFTGTYSLSAKQWKSINLSTLIPSSIIDYGGTIQQSTWFNTLPLSYIGTDGALQSEATIWYDPSNNTGLTVSIYFSAAQSNSKYDVWVKYTK